MRGSALMVDETRGKGQVEKKIDLFDGMPGHALHILTMLHEDTHALEIGIRMYLERVRFRL